MSRILLSTLKILPLITNIEFIFSKSKSKNNESCLPGSMQCVDNMLHMCDINNSWTVTDCPSGTECRVEGGQVTCVNTGDASENFSHKKKSKRNKNGMSSKPSSRKEKETASGKDEEVSMDSLHSLLDNNQKPKNKNRKNKSKEEKHENSDNKDDVVIHSSVHDMIEDLADELKADKEEGNNSEKEQSGNMEKPETGIVGNSESEKGKDDSMVKVIQTIIIKDSSNFLNDGQDSLNTNHNESKKIRRILIKKTANNKKNQENKSKKKHKKHKRKNDPHNQNDNPTQDGGNNSPQSNDKSPSEGSKPSTENSSPSQKNSSPTQSSSDTSPSPSTPTSSSIPSPSAGSAAKPDSKPSAPKSELKPAASATKPESKTAASPTTASKATESKGSSAAKPADSPNKASSAAPKPAGGANKADSSKSGGDSKAGGDSKSGGESGGGDAGKFTPETITKIVSEAGFEAKPEYVEAVSKGISEIEDEGQRAMFLAQIIHESGGLSVIEEMKCAEGNACASEYRDDVGLPDKDYHGRGFIQLTWGANYKAASEGLGLGDELLSNPEQVAKDPSMGMKTSVWFWNERVAVDPGVQKNQFGSSTNVINGPIECSGAGNDTPAKRYKIYKIVAEAVGITDLATEAGCGDGSGPAGGGGGEKKEGAAAGGEAKGGAAPPAPAA